jgi:heme-degrading monooxygenase HmoA
LTHPSNLGGTCDLREKTVRALLIRHRVSDYDAWKRAFDSDADIRRANGAKGARVLRSDSDHGEVWLLVEWDDLARARLFTRSDESLDFLERAGVTDRPDYWYLEEVERPQDQCPARPTVRVE